jgi:hypothetical protein
MRQSTLLTFSNVLFITNALAAPVHDSNLDRPPMKVASLSPTTFSAVSLSRPPATPPSSHPPMTASSSDDSIETSTHIHARTVSHDLPLLHHHPRKSSSTPPH